MDFLEYNDASAEVKGAMCPGRLKLTDQHVIFKNTKTGKVDQISASDIDLVNWQRLLGAYGIRIFLKNGSLHRFGGLKETEQDKIAKFFTLHYKLDMLEKELSLKGWNWGVAKFNGSVLSFDIGSNTAFEIPLNNVSHCTTGKNEVTLEFHQNDDAAVGLMEMRYHIPSSELAGDVDPVDSFHQQVMKQASVINLSGDSIATFKEIQCLTPRGRYDIKLFQTFFQLHGKTFDYKIPLSTVLRLFILPHKDSRQMFFVVSLDPPIKQELKEKFEGKLTKEMSGPTYEVMGKVMKAVVNRKITVPGGFIGSFDFEVETKSGVMHTFSSIEKGEYAKLYDFITAKKLRVKNRGKNDKPSYDDDFGNSDKEDEPDAYLARVKAEAEERDEEAGGESEDESTDEDFNPDQQESDSEKPRKRRAKKERDENKPKRPATAFMVFLNANREKIKSENPGISITEVSKKGGEMWRELKDKSEWESKVQKLKNDYVEAMKEYKESGGGNATDNEDKEKKKPAAKKEMKKKTSAPSTPMKNVKSKEYISDDDDSSSEDEAKKKTQPKKEKSPEPKTKEKVKKEKKGSDEDDDDDDIDEPIESTPPSSDADESGSGSD
uniref:FACT complex subunit SSRP1 n=1 Tax=Timema genevievae TaxID=629358 RepID=A0A7R9K3C7_TIMGE|nr:unnamed protein product [Timema genevievae]